MANKDLKQADGSSGSETRKRKLNSENSSDKTNQEIQKAWKEFTKDSERARREINEAFDTDNKDWSLGRVGIVVMVTIVVATGLGVIIKFLTW